jgi:hypothetical protein
MGRNILITCADQGSEGAAIGIERKGHDVIAVAHTWSQVIALRAKAEELSLSMLRIEK